MNSNFLNSQEKQNREEARQKVEDLGLDNFSLMKNFFNKIGIELARSLTHDSIWNEEGKKAAGKFLVFIQTVNEETSREDYVAAYELIEKLPISKEDKNRALAIISINRPTI